MRLIGYARVSTIHQNLDRQRGELRKAGCKTIFQEKASGKDVKGRPELERAIDELGAGDVLVLAEWDRATRSMMDGIAIMRRRYSRSVSNLTVSQPSSPMRRSPPQACGSKRLKERCARWMRFRNNCTGCCGA
jgi:DNA invertase Pin-like site-specific DNA recombinase